MPPESARETLDPPLDYGSDIREALTVPRTRDMNKKARLIRLQEIRKFPLIGLLVRTEPICAYSYFYGGY